MKCIYRKTAAFPRCDKEADYIYLGKSYCAEHMELRAEEIMQETESLISTT